MAEDIQALIDRTCVGKGNGPYANYKGCFLAEIFKNFAEEIDNLKVNNSDIWVTTFPKSGTTWLQEMVYLIATDCDFNSAKENITERFPFLEFDTLFDFDAYPSFREKVHSDPVINSVQCVNNIKHTPRMIKTHLPYFLLPKDIRNGKKNPKILHVTRDPKDVCVSYYYHYLSGDHFKGTFEEFCKLFIADKVLFAPFWDNVLSYWQRRNETNILFLKYEDMKSDLRSVILKVAAFLNKTLTNDQIEKLLQHLDFDLMKDNVAVNYENFDISTASSIKHMRKGIVGDYKNLMSFEIIEEFDEWIANNDRGIFDNDV